MLRSMGASTARWLCTLWPTLDVSYSDAFQLIHLQQLCSREKARHRVYHKQTATHVPTTKSWRHIPYSEECASLLALEGIE